MKESRKDEGNAYLNEHEGGRYEIFLYKQGLGAVGV